MQQLESRHKSELANHYRAQEKELEQLRITHERELEKLRSRNRGDLEQRVRGQIYSNSQDKYTFGIHL